MFYVSLVCKCCSRQPLAGAAIVANCVSDLTLTVCLWDMCSALLLAVAAAAISPRLGCHTGFLDTGLGSSGCTEEKLGQSGWRRHPY